MEKGSVDFGSDAVALAILDLTDEIRKLRMAVAIAATHSFGFDGSDADGVLWAKLQERVRKLAVLP